MSVISSLRAAETPTLSAAKAASILGIDLKTIRETIRKDGFPRVALLHVCGEPCIDPQALADHLERMQAKRSYFGGSSRWPASHYEADIHRTIADHEDPEIGADPAYTAHKVGRFFDLALEASAKGIKEEGLVSTRSSFGGGTTTYYYADGRIDVENRGAK